jgi:hypothetical protein
MLASRLWHVGCILTLGLREALATVIDHPAESHPPLADCITIWVSTAPDMHRHSAVRGSAVVEAYCQPIEVLAQMDNHGTLLAGINVWQRPNLLFDRVDRLWTRPSTPLPSGTAAQEGHLRVNQL